MKNIKTTVISFLMFGFAILSASCEPETHSLGNLPDKSVLNFEITQDLGLKPGGNVVNLKSLTPGIIPYWSYSDSNGQELGHTNLGETSVSLPFAGTYIFKYTVFDKAGSVSASKAVTVTENDTSLFSDPRWSMLTNGEAGKTWIINRVTESPLAFVGSGYINTVLGGDSSWFPGSINDIPWSGIENKNFGEVTFDLNGGYNVKVVQTSEITGSLQQATAIGTFSFLLTANAVNDRIVFNGGLKMLHTNAYYTSLSSGFSFSNVRLIELTNTSLRYAMIAADGGVIVVNLIPKAT